jgi:ABC-type phosphate/phosphonate transport system substrate-binding protein
MDAVEQGSGAAVVARRPVGNARLYSSIAPGAARAWRQLLDVVAERSGVDLEIVDHAYPLQLADLWARADLGCALMCGWPFAREGATKPLIAAPVPDAEWSARRAVYRAEYVVAAGAPFARIEDTFGRRFGYNLVESHSGYNLPRHHLSRFADSQPLFAATLGPFVTHLRAIEAVLAGQADVVAIDSYYLALARRHAPDLAAGLRVIGATEESPIPPFIASPAMPNAQAVALRDALLGFGQTADDRALLAELCLAGFAAVAAADYEATLAVERTAAARGYAVIR